MADQDSFNPGNGSGQPEGAAQVAVIAQYIKDLSVESPSSPQVFQWQEQPQLEVQFNINGNTISEDVHEVVLKLEVSARSDKGVHFLIDLSYAGLFGLRGLPQEAFAPFMLVEAPRLLFPFARQVIAEASQNTGFPPLLLDPIDFASVYVSQLQQQQGQAPAEGTEDGSEQTPETPAGGDDKQG